MPTSNTPHFFTQLRPGRPVGKGKRQIDKDVQHLYVCAHWRVVGADGKTKQAGCSYSAEKHGFARALKLAVAAANKRGGYKLSLRAAAARLTTTPQQQEQP